MFARLSFVYRHKLSEAIDKLTHNRIKVSIKGKVATKL